MATRTIELTRGLAALVDGQDFARLTQFKWCASRCQRRKSIAVRAGRTEDGRRTTVAMHREIMGLAPGDPREVDHRNHDTLDNRRANLRVVTPKANKQYQPSRGGSSTYVGVTWDEPRGRWRAQIQIDGRVKNLGRFLTEHEAAAARDAFVRSIGSAHKLNLEAR